MSDAPKETMRERLARLEQTQRSHGDVLFEIKDAVCGRADAPGIKGRVDRMETGIRLLKVTGAAILAVLGAVAAWAKHLKD